MQIYTKAPVLESLLIKLKAWTPVTLLKRDSNTSVFLPNLWNFSEHLLLQNISGGCFLDSKKLIPDLLVTRKLIPKGTLGLLYTNIAQLMAHITVVYVAVYLTIMLPGILQRVIKSQRVTYIIRSRFKNKEIKNMRKYDSWNYLNIANSNQKNFRIYLVVEFIFCEIHIKSI